MRLSGNEIWEMPICLLSESLLWGCGVTPIYFCRAAVQGCIGCAQYRAPVLGGMWECGSGNPFCAPLTNMNTSCATVSPQRQGYPFLIYSHKVLYDVAW